MQVFKVIITNDALLKEIESVFPLVEMPLGIDLAFHKHGCLECDELREDLEQYRDKEITGEAIRLIHQELSSLSAKAWRWVLPHYLRFCLTPEAKYNRMETEFFIYSLGPDLKFQQETLQRLSMLNKDQINCLVHFLEWCLNDEYWNEYYPEDINKAINFLSTINS